MDRQAGRSPSGFTVQLGVWVLLAWIPESAFAQFTTVYNVPSDTLPPIVGSNTQVNIGVGGNPGVIRFGDLDGLSTNIELNMEGGALGVFSDGYGDVTVNLRGSTYGTLRLHEGGVANYLSGFNDLTVYPFAGVVANIVGGEIDAVVVEGGVTNVLGGQTRFINARGPDTHAIINISGGVLESISSGSRSEVFVSGGSVGRALSSGTNLTTFTGGSIGRLWQTDSPGASEGIVLAGDSFQLNGVPVAGLNVVGNEVVFAMPAQGAVLTGVLKDGTAIAIEVGTYDGEVLYQPIRLRAASAAPSNETTPQGLRAGENLIWDAGDLGPYFAAHRQSSLELRDGGEIGHGFRATGASVTVSGGSLGNDSFAMPGTSVTQTGGRIGDGFTVHPDATMVIQGGAIGDGLSASSTYGHIRGTGSVELQGKGFAIDGVQVAGLDTPGSSVNVPVSPNVLAHGDAGRRFSFRRLRRRAGYSSALPRPQWRTPACRPSPATPSGCTALATARSSKWLLAVRSATISP